MGYGYGNDDDESNEQESGSSLRRKLEEALAENQKLRERVVEAEAVRLVKEKGYTLVKPEDLKGAKPDEIEAKAEAIQKERQGLQRELVKAAFQSKGIEGDLDELVDQFLSGEGAGMDTSAISRANSLGKIDAKPSPLVNPNELSPQAKIEYALRQRAAKQKK